MNIAKPAAAAILVLSCCFANGQSFEVASIHRNLRGAEDTGVHILPGGRISVTSATLKTLIPERVRDSEFSTRRRDGLDR
jgi:hypothetical protein